MKWPKFAHAPVFDCLLAINLCHISPVEVTSGLFAGAGRVLRKGGRLMIYGPFMVDGKPTTPSNEQFDKLMRNTNSAWGLRDISELDSFGEPHGLKRIALDEMQAFTFVPIPAGIWLFCSAIGLLCWRGRR